MDAICAKLPRKPNIGADQEQYALAPARSRYRRSLRLQRRIAAIAQNHAKTPPQARDHRQGLAPARRVRKRQARRQVAAVPTARMDGARARA
jgi:hypothetical protein